MPLIRWNPLHDLDEFFHELEFPRRHGWDLAVDIYEDENAVTVEMQVPGIDSEKVEIEVADNHLHISGSREEKEEKKEKHYYRKEIRRGSFERVVVLPCAVDESKTRAEFQDGVLKITLPKVKGKEPSKIKVTKASKK